MAAYADVYALPIPRRNLSGYRRLARRVGRIFREHGALEYREFLGDDLDAKGLVPFPRKVKLKRGEILIFAVVGFRSKSHRDRVNERVVSDPRIGRLTPDPPLFDAKRMLFGGFSTLVEA